MSFDAVAFFKDVLKDREVLWDTLDGINYGVAVDIIIFMKKLPTDREEKRRVDIGVDGLIGCLQFRPRNELTEVILSIVPRAFGNCR